MRSTLLYSLARKLRMNQVLGDIIELDSNYARLSKNYSFASSFQRTIFCNTTKAILFIGYSISDPDFRLLLDRQLTTFKEYIPERYALMSGVGEIERDVLWRTAGIKVIPYDEHDDIKIFLRNLRNDVIQREGVW